jgi:1-phosphatidylinositol phosphodiesterase
MGGVADGVTIAEINIPGTHDSGADYGCPTAFYSAYAKAQNDDIRAQLDKGIRYLDIRLRRAGSQFTIHHGQCYQQKNFGGVLAQVAAFLAANPTEFVLMRVKEEHSAMDNSDNFSVIFQRYQDQYPGIWYAATPTSVPKVGDVRGKIVILDDAGLGKGIAYSGPLVSTQDEYFLGTAGGDHLEKKWHYVTGHLAKAITAKPRGGKIFINHLSATGLDAGAGSLVAGFFGAAFTPADFADSIFPKLEKKLMTKRGYWGVFPMDFPTARLVETIILVNPYYINR